MKQHPIPQNILDIEFKLFTRFTVREFIYMAVGVGFGGIFLLLYSNNTLPALIAIPVFLLSSGVGLFLGLVPINEQNADIFLGNYFRAITRPTQRVWKSEQFDEKVEWIAQGKGITLTQATMERGEDQEQGGGKVIGGTSKGGTSNQFIEESALDKIDQEEEERLKELEEIAMETGDTAATKDTDLPPVPNVRPKSPEEIAQEETLPEQQESSNPPAVGPAEDGNPEEPVEEKNETPPEQKVAPEQDEPVGSPPVEETTPEVSSVSSVNLITISKDTVDSYKTQVEGYEPQVGTISMYITDKNGEPIPQALAMVKDSNNAVVQVYITDPQGLITPDHQLALGTYSIEIKEDNHEFPAVNYILDNTALPVANIKSLD